MRENFGHKNPYNGLHAFCAFVKKRTKCDHFEDLLQLPCEQSRFASQTIRNLSAFDLTALSRVKQTKLSVVSVVFRREEKFAGQGDEKSTMQNGPNIKTGKIHQSNAADVVEVGQFLYVVQYARKVFF